MRRHIIHLAVLVLAVSSSAYSADTNTWIRDQYSGPGGGRYTGPHGGLYTAPGGGAYTGPGGGLYTGPGGECILGRAVDFIVGRVVACTQRPVRNPIEAIYHRGRS